jgi:GNAT superfamily N-acetyltransferase
MLATVSTDVTPTKLIGSVREDFAEYREMLASTGFEIVMRFPRSELDLVTFDSSPYAGLVARIENELRVVQLSTLQAEHDDWMVRLEDMSWEIQQDIPYHGELIREPMEEFAKMFEYENNITEGWFIAVDEATNQYVGISSFWLSLTDAQKLYTGLTGVRRAHRRKGVATALKILAIRWAQARGCTVAETDNEENNPMYQINLKLGFRPIPAMVDYKLDLAEGA